MNSVPERVLKQQVHVLNLGLTDYRYVWDVQSRLFRLRLGGIVPDLLLLNEHEHVYTLGKNTDLDHLLAKSEELKSRGIDVVPIDRGGDVTYHGPGQLVGYPILDLAHHYLDLHRYLRDLEEVIIRTTADFGLSARRDDGYTGVWVGDDKIAAIGVKVSRWVTMHGFAFNINTDLSYFDRIIPCGIFHRGVTSLERLLGCRTDFGEVTSRLLRHFGGVFHVEMVKRESAEFLRSMELTETAECA